MSTSPRIALTPGEPAGIGPDLCLMLAAHEHPVELVVLADPALLASRARTLGLDVTLHEHAPGEPARLRGAGHLTVAPVPLEAPVEPGQLNPANADYVLDTLGAAADGCLAGRFDALVTGPVHKGLINQAGHRFQGHTEFLAERAGVAQTVMMLATPALRVALATTHLPLRAVPDALTPARLEGVLRILAAGLRDDYGIAAPRIAVCGLNPHAGEAGHLGREEIEVIEPVLERLRGEGLALTGPLPADTAFTPRHLDDADAVLAMYHDQGLPVLKYEGFGRAVNITLGLPFPRTSVDHGTALDLAGTGRADPGSLEAALEEALTLIRQHREDHTR